MKRLFTRLKSKVLPKLLFSYVIMLLIPLAVSAYTHTIGLGALRRNSVESNKALLQDIMNETESRLYAFKESAQQLSCDRQLLKLLNGNQPVEGQLYIDFSRCITTTYNYLSSREMLDNAQYYLYFQSYDVVITKDTLYKAPLYHQARIMGHKADPESFENWHTSLNNRYITGSYVYSGYSEYGYPQSDSILFFQSVPSIYNQTPRGVLVVEIPKRAIRNLFGEKEAENSLYCIQDSSGNIIVSAGNEKYLEAAPDLKEELEPHTIKLGKEKLIVTILVSPDTGWRYIALIPEAQVYSGLQKIQQVYLLAITGVAALGALLAILLARKSSQPILHASKTLSSFFGSEQQEQDPYRLITSGVSKLISNQLALQQDLTEQKPRLEASFLNDLLEGRVYSQQDIDGFTHYFGLPLLGQGYYIVLVRLYNDKPLSNHSTSEDIGEVLVWQSVVKKALASSFEKGVILHDMGQKRIAAICCLQEMGITDSTAQEYIGKAVTRANAMLLDTYNMQMFAAVSGYCQYTEDLWNAYQQAEATLQYVWGDTVLAFYQQVPAKDSSYFYPPEQERRLITFAELGDFEQVAHVLDALIHENIQRRTLTIQSAHELAVELRSTLHKLAGETLPEQVLQSIRQINTRQDITACFSQIRDIYQQLCNANNTLAKNSSKQFINDVKEYIEQNYTNPDMGLYIIATHFNLSEGYFSSFFKENAGINFTDYLEKVRLEKSLFLLKTTSMTIDEIAGAVGYNSGQSYRRAFKKVYSNSPTHYR